MRDHCIYILYIYTQKETRQHSSIKKSWVPAVNETLVRDPKSPVVAAVLDALYLSIYIYIYISVSAPKICHILAHFMTDFWCNHNSKCAPLSFIFSAHCVNVTYIVYNVNMWVKIQRT